MSSAGTMFSELRCSRTFLLFTKSCYLWSDIFWSVISRANSVHVFNPHRWSWFQINGLIILLKYSFLIVFLSLSNGWDSIVRWTIVISSGTSWLREFVLFINFQFSQTKFHRSVYALLLLSWHVSIKFNSLDLISMVQILFQSFSTSILEKQSSSIPLEW